MQSGAKTRMTQERQVRQLQSAHDPWQYRHAAWLRFHGSLRYLNSSTTTTPRACDPAAYLRVGACGRQQGWQQLQHLRRALLYSGELGERGIRGSQGLRKGRTCKGLTRRHCVRYCPQELSLTVRNYFGPLDCCRG